MEKSEHFEYPVSDLIKNRKSVRAFSPALIEQEKIHTLFEATRWAPSSTNEQPWLYMYATRDQGELWDKLFHPLNPTNKIWVKDAPLLIFSMARKNFTRFPGNNAHALYDLGGANSFLSLQAVDLGLQIRQIAGYNTDDARSVLNIPEEYALGVYIAVGYPGDPSILPEHLQAREGAPRERYRQQEFVMNKIF